MSTPSQVPISSKNRRYTTEDGFGGISHIRLAKTTYPRQSQRQGIWHRAEGKPNQKEVDRVRVEGRGWKKVCQTFAKIQSFPVNTRSSFVGNSKSPESGIYPRNVRPDRGAPQRGVAQTTHPQPVSCSTASGKQAIHQTLSTLLASSKTYHRVSVFLFNQLFFSGFFLQSLNLRKMLRLFVFTLSLSLIVVVYL